MPTVRRATFVFGSVSNEEIRFGHLSSRNVLIQSRGSGLHLRGSGGPEVLRRLGGTRVKPDSPRAQGMLLATAGGEPPLGNDLDDYISGHVTDVIDEGVRCLMEAGLRHPLRD
jgi:hypothetical protein